MNGQWLRRLSVLVMAASIALIASCDRGTESPGSTALSQPDPGGGTVGDVPLGDVAGAEQSNLAALIPNPYGNDPQAVQQGHDLFIKMNCAGCHGYDAKGAMGPDLTDSYWRYGGVPASIFNSIYQGRPQGMPAWNPALPPQDIWKLVAYIQSLGGSYPAGQYQAWLQGDKRGDNIPGEVAATLLPNQAARTPEPKGGTDHAPNVAPQPDIAPAPGAGK